MTFSVVDTSKNIMQVSRQSAPPFKHPKLVPNLSFIIFLLFSQLITIKTMYPVYDDVIGLV